MSSSDSTNWMIIAMWVSGIAMIVWITAEYALYGWQTWCEKRRSPQVAVDAQRDTGMISEMGETMIMAHNQAGASTQPIVLLAEDDREMRTLISRALTKQGYEVREVCDGVGLVAQLGDTIENRQVPQSERFDLIISDIRMPGVFGLSVLEGMQVVDGAPPTILITAFGDAETHKHAQELGAVAVFDKPFDMNDLITFVRAVVPPAATSG